MKIEIKYTKKYGKGVYATKPIKKNEEITTDHLVVLNSGETYMIDHTVLGDYMFYFNNDSGAIALGVSSLLNHYPEKQNCDWSIDEFDRTITIVATKNIKTGEQLFVDYGYELADRK